MSLAGSEAVQPGLGTEATPAPEFQVLLVDDDEVDRAAVKRGLAHSPLNAVIVEATSRAEALAELEQRAFDCVLLDYNIPGTDGLSLLREIRGARPLLPVVVLTGQGDEQLAVELMKAGAADYLAKAGLSPARLASALRHAVELGRAEALAQRAREELRSNEARARFLAEAGMVLASSLELRELLPRIARHAVTVLGDACLIRTVAPGMESTAAIVGHPAVGGQWSRSGYWGGSAPEEAVDRVISTGELEEHSPPAAAAATPASASAQLVVPLGTRGRVLGAMAVIRHDRGLGFPAADVALVREFAARIALTLENVRLYQEARRAREAEREARAQAEVARLEAEQANRSKSEFLARMSHDLRTPLNAIGGYSDLIELGIHGPVTEAQHEALARIQRAKEHLLTLINDILSFAKLESGQIGVQLEPVPLREVFAEIGALVEPQVAARGLSYLVAAPARDVLVLADRDRLLQVLLNLLTNAVKFTERGAISLETEDAGAVVRVQVRDTGLGIPPERQPQIFDPFVQGADPERQKQGVGLGLAISRELLRLMRGSIEVQSRVGEGSVFTVSLQRAQPGELPPQA